MKRTLIVFLLFIAFGIQKGVAQSPEELMSTIKQLEYKYNTLEAKYKKLQVVYNNVIRENEGRVDEMDQYGDSLADVIDDLSKQIKQYQQKEIDEEARIKKEKTTQIEIKDPVFYRYLLQFHDVDNDGEITEWDASNTYVIDLSLFGLNGEKVSSMAGVEHFRNLKKLCCSNNNIGTLNVGSMTNLEVLLVSNCGLSTLNLSHNTRMKELDVSSNDLSTLDIGKCAQLQMLNCSHNMIGKLDLHELAELVRVDCGFNRIKDLSLVNNRKIDEINCSSNSLTMLNVNNGFDIYYIDCQNNVGLTQIKAGKKQNFQIIKKDDGVMISKE